MSTQGNKLKAIADAIRAKEGSSDPIVASDFPARIAAIETGIQLPTLTNPGTAADLASEKQLIDQNGQIVTGNVSTIESGYTGSLPGTSAYWNTGSYGNTIYIKGTIPFTYGTLFRNGAGFTASLAAENFGNATAADVAYGKTFTSEAGVKVTGTAQQTPLKGLTFTFSGSGSNGEWVTVYPGASFPLALTIWATDGITSGNNIFTMTIVGTSGVYVTQSTRAMIENVNYGESADQYSFAMDMSAGQLFVQTISGTYFQYQKNYAGFLVYT